MLRHAPDDRHQDLARHAVKWLATVVLLAALGGCAGTHDAVCGDVTGNGGAAEAIGLLVVTGACGALWVAEETAKQAGRTAARLAGVEQARADRRAWLLRDAANGDDEAAYRLAVLMAFEDEADATRWACSAASNGHRPARVLLASWFDPERFETEVRPTRITPDPMFAYVWYALATRRGDDNAERFRDRLRQALAPAARAEADRLLRDWRPGLCPQPVQPARSVTGSS